MPLSFDECLAETELCFSSFRILQLKVHKYQWDCLLETYEHSIPDLLDALLEEARREIVAQTAVQSAVFPGIGGGYSCAYLSLSFRASSARGSTKRLGDPRETGGRHAMQLWLLRCDMHFAEGTRGGSDHARDAVRRQRRPWPRRRPAG